MVEEVSEFSVLPRTDKVRKYPCGHEGPAKFDHVLFGKKIEVKDELFEILPKCGQCLLDEIKPLLTKCAKCGTPIFPGESCIVYGDKLCCLGLECGPGPLYAMPGIWDGEQFVDGVTAGTVVTMSLPRRRH